MENAFERIRLGTVQIGMPYGYDGVTMPSFTEARNILELSKQYGVFKLDTASVYGTSEEVIGEAVDARFFDVVSKSPKLDSSDWEDRFDRALRSSLKKLKVDYIAGYMLHNAADVMSSDSRSQAICRKFKNLKDSGIVKRVGVSVYHPYEVREIERLHDCFDFYQCPLSILDQRFLKSDILSFLSDRNKKVQFRSIFAQGVLLIDMANLPDRLGRLRPWLKKFNDVACALGLSPIQMCLSFVFSTDARHEVVIGTKTLKQWHETLTNIGCLQVLENDMSFLDCQEAELFDPRKW